MHSVSAKKKILFYSSAFLLTACSPRAPLAWWKNVNTKAADMLVLQAKYDALEAKDKELNRKYLELEHDYTALLAEHETKETGRRNLAATGSKVGRTLASISYKVPADLNLEQKYTLAFDHMREKRFAEAAATFDSFLWSPEGASFQKSGAFYNAGVAWYEMQNFKKAKECFVASLSHAEMEERAPLKHKVDLWMRVIDHKLQPNEELVSP